MRSETINNGNKQTAERGVTNLRARAARRRYPGRQGGKPTADCNGGAVPTKPLSMGRTVTPPVITGRYQLQVQQAGRQAGGGGVRQVGIH